jgi:membrane protease YdiL (CAAX protease family)
MHPFGKILILIALLGTGMVFASLGVFVIALLQGYDLTELMDLVKVGEGNYTTALLRGTLWMQAIFGFLAPAGIFLLLFYKSTWKAHLGLDKMPGLMVSMVAIVALFAAYPLVQLAYEANMALPLPEWMHTMEASAAEIMQDILVMDSVGGFLLTLLLVAVLPAIGEELVFRGILQTQIAEWTRRPVLSVWIAAIIFSAIHMQFEGFLPRMALGVILGLLYLWTNNLWAPILAHAVNNGFQVCVLYFSGIDLSEMDQESPMGLNGWMIAGSVVVLFLCYRVLRQTKSSDA